MGFAGFLHVEKTENKTRNEQQIQNVLMYS